MIIKEITKENAYNILEDEYDILQGIYLDFLTETSKAVEELKLKILCLSGMVELFYKKDVIGESEYELFCDRINLKLMILDRFLKK